MCAALTKIRGLADEAAAVAEEQRLLYVLGRNSMLLCKPLA